MLAQQQRSGGVTRPGFNGQQAGLGGGLSINSNSSSNLNSMYGSGSIASNGSNRMLGDGAVIGNSNLGNSRIISSHNNNSNQQHFEAFPPSGRGYSAVAQLGANRGNNDHDFAIDNEDFPALPGTSLLNKNLSDHVVGSSDSKLHASGASSSQVQGANNMFSGSGSSDFNAQGQHGSSHPLLSNIASASAGASQLPVTKEQKFGLAGLLDVIRFTDKVRH